MEEIEIWKDIPNYKGLYQVSNLGRVRSLDREIVNSHNVKSKIKGLIRKQHKNTSGYYYVHLSKQGVDKFFFVHRLVAEAFIPNPDGFSYINHKDECKTNNIYTNLEWCTLSYNQKYGTKIQRTLETCRLNNSYKNGIDTKTELGICNGRKPVAMYDLLGNLIKTFPSLTSASKELKISTGLIWECCNGYRKSTRGYKWQYAK